MYKPRLAANIYRLFLANLGFISTILLYGAVPGIRIGAKSYKSTGIDEPPKGRQQKSNDNTMIVAIHPALLAVMNRMAA